MNRVSYTDWINPEVFNKDCLFRVVICASFNGMPPRPAMDPPPLIISFLGENNCPVEVSISDACATDDDDDRSEIESSWRSAVRLSDCRDVKDVSDDDDFERGGCMIVVVCSDSPRLSDLQSEFIKSSDISSSKSLSLLDAASLLYNLGLRRDFVIESRTCVEHSFMCT